MPSGRQHHPFLRSIDADGNVVANTYSLNFNYGLGLVADGTGIMLNNELDDFAAKPGVPNAFGLVGGAANAPGPGRRPLSSMTPTIVFKDTKPVLVTGAPGGSRIITTVLQVIVNVHRRRHDHRQCGGGAAAASPVAAGRGRGRARTSRRTRCGRSRRWVTRCGSVRSSAQRIRSGHAEGRSPAPPTSVRAARQR